MHITIANQVSYHSR